MVRRKPETHFPLQVTAPNSCVPNLPPLLDDHLSMTWWEGTSSHGKFGLVQCNTTISHAVHDSPLLHLQLEGLIWGFASSRTPPFLFLRDPVLLVLEAGREDAMRMQWGNSSLLPPLLLLLLWLTSEARLQVSALSGTHVDSLGSFTWEGSVVFSPRQPPQPPVSYDCMACIFLRDGHLISM